MFSDLGFCGDAAGYDAPQNCFMVDVIDRRRGLPITLSLITVAVAEAAGVRAFAVALPKHFAVGVHRKSGFILLDPFNHGRLLSSADVEKLSGLSSGDVVGQAVAQTSPRSILMRMLANLHASYLRRGEREPLVRVLSRMLLFEPRHPALLVQRAQVLVEEGELTQARADAEAALALRPDNDSERAATDLLKKLEEAGRYVH
jgi:regulator of sirC expression with transglutaminase-like and TPR domain